MTNLCIWCHEREAVVDDECIECSRLPGHSHDGEDWRDDEIARLNAALERAHGYAAFLYACAKAGEQPQTYAWYLEKSKQ